MRFLIAATCVLFGVGLFAEETAPKWCSARRDLDVGSWRGSATITVDKPAVALGAKFEVDIRFRNGGGGDDFYNPFFNHLVPLPARLAIFDSQHKYLGDLLRWEGGSRRSPGINEWAWIPGECYVGCSERFRAGYVPGTVHGVMSNLLPPGTYYLQMIYFKAFASTNPARLESNPPTDVRERVAKFLKTFDCGELFRSNVATIRFTAR
jgi:hypothetical protein